MIKTEKGKQEKTVIESGDKIFVKSDQAIDLLVGNNEKDDKHENKQEHVETIMPIQKTYSQ